MGITDRIVLIIIGFGLVVTAIWFWRALAGYPREPGASSPAAAVERDLTDRTTPAKVGWNWGAFFLGPLWYFGQGLWVYAIILVILIMLSGGILLPFVMLYSGAKANETLDDEHLARHSVY